MSCFAIMLRRFLLMFSCVLVSINCSLNKSLAGELVSGTSISSGATGSQDNPIMLKINTPIRNVNTDSPLYYIVDVPKDKASLVISFAWGKDYKLLGDPNLYVRYQQIPTTKEYDCRSEWKRGDTETCIFDKPKAGRYYILVKPVIKEGEKAGDYEINDGLLYATTDLFNVSQKCAEADADIRAQILSRDQQEFICQRLAVTQKRFLKAFASISKKFGQPIENDLNHRVVAELYADISNHRTWMSYLHDSSNDSGIFHEGFPEDSKSLRATFRTFNGLHWTNGVTHYWNLEHEFAHYLDGRYNKKGDYYAMSDHNMTWWSEGLAQYFGFPNGSERRFSIAHNTLFPRNILDCKSSLKPYSDSRSNTSIKDAEIFNDSKQILTLYKVNASTGDILLSNNGVILAPGQQWRGFADQNWLVGDRFVLQNDQGSCVATATLIDDMILVYRNHILTTKGKVHNLKDIFDGNVGAYSWGYLAFSFFIEEQKSEIKRFLALTRLGKYDEADALLDDWSTRLEADFQAWLYWGTKREFLASFERNENKLLLNSHATLNGSGDWAFKLSLEQDVDSLTFGTAGGFGYYDLLIGKDKPVHSVAALNPDAMICRTGENYKGPDQHCTLLDAKAGDYYITVDNLSDISVLADTHVYVCSGESCHNTIKLPIGSQLEKVEVMRAPRIVKSAAISSCALNQSYQLSQAEKNRLLSFQIKNNSTGKINLQRIESETGELSSKIISLADDEVWIPNDAVYKNQRFILSNQQGKCLGTIIALEAAAVTYFERTEIPSNSCELKENHSPTYDPASHASVRNESHEHVYVFRVLTNQDTSKKTNGLRRLNFYASLAPGETWDNITWNQGARIMLGTTNDISTAQCVAIFEVASDQHLAYRKSAIVSDINP